eukprot:s1614_g10.t1
MQQSPAPASRAVSLSGWDPRDALDAPAVAAPPPVPHLRQVLVREADDVAPMAPLAQRLRAAKPVTWRGRGDLVQAPWTPCLRGTWLVLDLWSGLAGLCIALLQLGLHFYGISAECDSIASEVARTNMPNLVHVDFVEELTAASFVPLLRRRGFRGVIMGGGSPCQGNTSLNLGRKGLQDPRSQQPLQLQRLRDEFLALPEMKGLELVTFLENVASMPAAVRREYSSWLGSEPVLIDAACCGWVQRRRLYWLTSRSSALHSLNAPIVSIVQRPGKVPWTQQEVYDHAARLKDSLPVTIKELILSPEWKGGDLIQLENEISRPTADDCILNYIWLRPFVATFPESVCSGFYAADVFRALDVSFDNKLLQSSDPMATKKSMAVDEGSKMKRLMGGLRYLWRSKTGNHPRMTELKSYLKRSPQAEARRRQAEDEGDDDMGEPPHAVDPVVEAVSDHEGSDGDEGCDGDDGENEVDQGDGESSSYDPATAPTLRLGDPSSQEMPPLTDDQSEGGSGSEESGSEESVGVGEGPGEAGEESEEEVGNNEVLSEGDQSDDQVVGHDDSGHTDHMGLVDPRFDDPSANELFQVPDSQMQIIKDRNKVTELCMDLMKYWQNHDPARGPSSKEDKTKKSNKRTASEQAPSAVLCPLFLFLASFSVMSGCETAQPYRLAVI